MTVEPVVPEKRKRGVAADMHSAITFNTRLTVAWVKHPSKGHAFINCHSPQDALEVRYGLHYTQLGAQVIRCSIGKKNNSSVFVGNLDKDITNEELREHVNACTDIQVINVFIPREKASDMTTDASHKRRLRDIFRSVSEHVEVNIPEDRGRRSLMKKAFITLAPNMNKEDHRALRRLMDNGCRGVNNELYRISKVVTCDLYCTQPVFRSVEGEIDREAHESECQVELGDTKKTPSDKRIHISGHTFAKVSA